MTDRPDVDTLVETAREQAQALSEASDKGGVVWSQLACEQMARTMLRLVAALSDLAARARRATELEAALREIIDVEDKTYWDDPSAGFAAIARAALAEDGGGA